MELNQTFILNMKKLLKEDYQNYIDSFSSASKRGMRVNQNYIDTKDFEKCFEFSAKKLNNFENLTF